MEPLRLADRENDMAGPFGYEDASIESDQGITSAMNVFLKKHRMTLTTLLQTVGALLLSGYSKKNDVVVGKVACRSN